MRIVSLVLLVAVAVAANPVSTEKPLIYNLDEAPQLFEQFIKDNNRHYKDAADRKLHYEAFVDTLKFVNKENAKGHSYTLGITPFADYTKEESDKFFGHPCLILPEGEQV